MKPIQTIAILITLAALTGCRAHVVKVNLKNVSAETVKTIIVDYPTATFGKDKLAPGEIFSYSIKPLETGLIRIQFTDAQGSIHTYNGSQLHKNDEGSIEVDISQSGMVVQPSLKR
jgi:hypothetical protein